MPKRSNDQPSGSHNEQEGELLQRLIGLGDRSMAKSYYPQLRKKLSELETFRLLVDRAVDAIFLVRLDSFAIDYGNDAAAHVFGHDKEAMVGMGMKEVLGNEVADLIAGGADGGCYNESVEWARGDMILETSLSSHKVDGVSYMVAVTRDVTRRVQGEREMERLKVMLESIVESMPSALIAVTAEGVVTQCNRRAVALSGVEATEAIGKPLAVVLPRLKELLPSVSRALKEKRPLLIKRNVLHVEGRLGYEDITVFPLDSQKSAGAVIRIDDVTETVRMEAVMVQTEKMMSIGGLAAGMAHEINNPLGGIIQGAQNLERRLMYTHIPANKRAAEEHGISLDNLSAYMKDRGVGRILDGIRESGARAASIVSNMLNFSRTSESQSTLNCLDVLLDGAVQLAQNDYNLEKKYDFMKIRLERDYEQPSVAVRCNATEIEQVFLNLVVNSAHAFAGQGDEEGARTISLKIRREGDYAVVTISDNGPGMEEHVRAHIFEPFYTTKKAGTGTGLGLSVSYFIISENHGGDIAVDSALGEGTTFTIKLPVLEEDQEEGVCHSVES